LNDNHTPSLSQLGDMLVQLGRYSEAIEYYDKMLAITPQSVEVMHNCALAMSKLGKFEALAMCDRALRLSPQRPELHHMRGSVLQSFGRLEEALGAYRQAITFNPQLFDAHNNMASVLRDLGRYEEALQSCKAALALRPQSGEAMDNYACCLVGLNRYDEAFAAFDEALRLAPHMVAAHNDRSNALFRLGRYEDALAGYDAAIRIAPQSAEAHSSKGSVLQLLGRQEEAAACYDEAIRVQPDSAFAQFNKAVQLLLLGDFVQGWPLYESRWRKPDQRGNRYFAEPLWLGKQPISGKTILLHAEQGLGDTIQFCRYVPMVEALGAQVIFEVPSTLMTLMQSLPGKRQLVMRGDRLPPFELQCPLLSLPLAFGTTMSNVPCEVPYLSATPSAIARWQKILGAKQRPRIGMVWSGTPKHKNDVRRSMPFAALAPLLALGGEFHALQKELRAEDAAAIAAGAPMAFHGEALGDMDATAGLLMAMDVVISVDTSVAHLAGALGKTVWTLLPSAPDFRWHLTRRDSPWYPTMRLIRQPQIDQWPPVITQVMGMLQNEYL